jgi:hypothetical protein
MVRLFQKRAGWFVAAGWLLFLLSAPIALVASMGAGINAFYHPLHQDAPYDRLVLQVTNVVIAVGFLAAVSSSIALAFKFRVAASILVVACWSATFAYSAGARLLVQPGPQKFDRYVGSQHFSIPWTYQPKGEEKPNSIGFSIWLCEGSLQGGYERGCRAVTQVRVSPGGSTLQREFDVTFWNKQLPDMKIGALREEHQEYIYAPPPDAQGRTRTTQYFARNDSQGQLSRLAVCLIFVLLMVIAWFWEFLL